ncbi:MAG: ATP-binding cassette domain-containing protein [Burkholderiales bacterium]
MITLENVSKAYDGHVALAPASFAFAPGATTVVIGPSGCGKSTVLRMIVGLVWPDSGRVLVEGEELRAENVERLRRRIGYVIQEGGLFPHLSAEGNVVLLARFLGRNEAWIAERVKSLAELLRIPSALLARFPGELSGGQRQRIGIMRALMLDPPVLLLDEPLGALDPVTRHALQDELKRIFAALGKTVVLVTHDMNEAAYFGDAIVMMREGRIVQRGTLADLLERPAEDYVRDFIRAQRTMLPSA